MLYNIPYQLNIVIIFSNYKNKFSIPQTRKPSIHAPFVFAIYNQQVRHVINCVATTIFAAVGSTLNPLISRSSYFNYNKSGNQSGNQTLYYPISQKIQSPAILAGLDFSWSYWSDLNRRPAHYERQLWRFTKFVSMSQTLIYQGFAVLCFLQFIINFDTFLRQLWSNYDHRIYTYISNITRTYTP